MNLCYLGPMRDYSGYGEANRHDIAALHSAGIGVYAKIVSYVTDPADFGALGELVNQLSERALDYKIKILHTTPDQFPRYFEPGKYHIGRVFWETDKLPDAFAEGLKVCDEIWTGSQANADAIRNAGILKPVYIIPQAIDIDRPAVEPYKLANVRKNAFYLYSIFEWTARKDPTTLLTAFYNEFKRTENVVLLIKTYRRDFTSKNKQNISLEAHAIKAKTKGNKPVLLYKELMDRDHIWRFHKTGDVFVSANRGEGWGLPQVEAMLAGKPVITTGYGGVAEYLTPREATVIPYKLVPVRGMNSQWYTPDQQWAEINIQDLQKAMRYAYTHKKEVRQMGANAQRYIIDKFKPSVIGQLMLERLEQIERKL